MKTYESPLTTLDLLAVARANPALHHVHAGTYPLDALPTLLVAGRPRHIVYNASPSTDPGTHWLSIWLSNDTTAEVMDSLGQRPVYPEVLSFLRRHASRSVYSTQRIQDINSNACGLYCLSHGLARARGYSFAQWLSRFSDCSANNDQIVYCEFMNQLAFPSLFTPRLRGWDHAVGRACRRKVCSDQEDSRALTAFRSTSLRQSKK